MKRWTVALAVTVCVVLGLKGEGALAADEAGKEARNKAIVLEVFKALETGALEPLERLFSQDAQFVIGLRTRKRGGPYDTFEKAAPFPGALTDVSVEVESLIAEGNQVAIQSLICGNHARPILGFEPTGTRLCSRYLNLYTVEDGIIVGNVVGVHRDQLREQLKAAQKTTQKSAE